MQPVLDRQIGRPQRQNLSKRLTRLTRPMSDEQSIRLRDDEMRDEATSLASRLLEQFETELARRDARVG